MWNLEIGLSGLDAARKGLDIIGNNIANAATEGYHRQRVEFSPAYARQEGGLLIGGGVEIEGITRLMDNFIELEIYRQQSALGQVSQESGTLQSIEAAFGELTGDTGLNAAIGKFFSSLSELSAHPDQVIYQNEVLTSAEAMTGRFRTLADFLGNLETQIRLQGENIVGQINAISTQIAELNDNIQRIEMSGSHANNLLDQRDQLISQLSGLVSVTTQQRDYGVVDVDVGGIPVVMGTNTIQLEIGLNNDGLLGVTPAGAFNYQTAIDGGELGGLISLHNTTISDIKSDLDTLAQAIIRQVNQYHFAGVGSDGSFTELAGWAMASETISDFAPPISDGSFFIRVTYTDPDTGEVTVSRHQINVDPATDTLTTVAAEISAITGLVASAGGTRLNIIADAGYEFDFLPAVLSEPTASDLSGGTVSVAGVYTGDANQTFTFTVAGDGSVGNGTLRLEVTDEDDNVVGTLNIGAGYAAGDWLELGNGIKIAVSGLNVGDSFEVDAYANTDTSGLLAAIGVNAFFAGNSASDFTLADNVADSPGRVASSLGAGMTDNTNALRLASLGEAAISDLDSLTPGQFYRRLVADIGQQLSMKQMSATNSENLVLSLTNQQSEISGVDINEEAAQMLVFEQMFQAMAKYLGTVQDTLKGLFDMV